MADTRSGVPTCHPVGIVFILPAKWAQDYSVDCGCECPVRCARLRRMWKACFCSRRSSRRASISSSCVCFAGRWCCALGLSLRAMRLLLMARDKKRINSSSKCYKRDYTVEAHNCECPRAGSTVEKVILVFQGDDAHSDASSACSARSVFLSSALKPKSRA